MKIPGVALINGRMSMAARLLTLSLVFCAPIALLMALFVGQCWKDISFARKEIAGGAYEKLIWPALRAAAAGEAADLGAAFQSARAQFDPQFRTADPSGTFAGARDAAARLEAGPGLMSAVADGSNLTLDPDLDSFYVMDAVTVRLPTLMQASSALNAAAALPASDAARPVKIAESLQTLRGAADAAASDFETAMKSNASGKTRAALAAHAAELKRLAQAVTGRRDALIAGGGGEALSRDVAALQQGTDASWGAARDEMQRLLQARVDGLMGALAINLALVGACLLAAAGLAVVIVTGLSGRLAALLGSMDRLIEGDTAVGVPHLDDRNETGRIAAAVEAFKRSLIEGERLRADAAAQEDAARESRAAAEAERAEQARKQSQVVTSLATGLERLTACALTFRIEEAFAPEYERLRSDFNSAMAQLQDSMKVVAANTSGIRSGAGEITHASDDLARRTEQQAASLEETAAALDEITATVTKTAQGAREAREVVAAAKGQAEHSGEVVREAVEAMSQIEASSQQIGQIISVIDEIAFQTNLLALNAGVEAARAGDAGRGFAVVASEVRALAQRSADAAKEIKTLINASSQHVDRGVTLVGETGEVLDRILSQVTQINTLVSEIALSAQEQASGLAQVNTAVNQMDQVTQQNAAMVEQSTAASHALASETAELEGLIARFDLGTAAQDATRAAA